jgi:hypothetical protein
MIKALRYFVWVNSRRFMPRKVLDMRAARGMIFRQGNQIRTAAGFAGVVLKARAAGGCGINRPFLLPTINSEMP